MNGMPTSTLVCFFIFFATEGDKLFETLLMISDNF
jgi:hypothetical protein